MGAEGFLVSRHVAAGTLTSNTSTTFLQKDGAVCELVLPSVLFAFPLGRSVHLYYTLGFIPFFIYPRWLLSHSGEGAYAL